jgi:predicted negative regulator of RcsB-dependent stress response
LLDEKSYDEALKQLEGGHAGAFDARFLELKGDVFAAQGKKSEARLAYKAAQGKSSAKPGPGLELLQQKLDSLGEAA